MSRLGGFGEVINEEGEGWVTFMMVGGVGKTLGRRGRQVYWD